MPKNDINYNRLGINLRDELHPLGTRVSEFRNVELASPLQNTVVTLPNRRFQDATGEKTLSKRGTTDQGKLNSTHWAMGAQLG